MRSAHRRNRGSAIATTARLTELHRAEAVRAQAHPKNKEMTQPPLQKKKGKKRKGNHSIKVCDGCQPPNSHPGHAIIWGSSDKMTRVLDHCSRPRISALPSSWARLPGFGGLPAIQSDGVVEFTAPKRFAIMEEVAVVPVCRAVRILSRGDLKIKKT